MSVSLKTDVLRPMHTFFESGTCFVGGPESRVVEKTKGERSQKVVS